MRKISDKVKRAFDRAEQRFGADLKALAEHDASMPSFRRDLPGADAARELWSYSADLYNRVVRSVLVVGMAADEVVEQMRQTEAGEETVRETVAYLEALREEQG